MAYPEVRPFQIHVADAKLDILRKKLDLAEFPAGDPVSNNWDYGAPVQDIRRLANYWKDGFNWRAQEAMLNRMPQFTTKIEIDEFGPLEIHFVHQKSGKAGSIPLLFCHGWPGSFLECQKIVPLLTAPESGPAFDLVAPSLPNFGFSQGPSKPGFRIPQYAECLHKLMLKLGYKKYVTQGGDWGFSITRLMGALYPENCLASHLNYVWAKPPTLLKHPLLYLKYLMPRTAKEKAGLARTKWFEDQGFGYNVEQSTRPTTIGVSLADSPVGLLAWIYEKLHDWTDAYPWTDDEILTWVSVYWFSTAGPAASVRIYYEAVHPDGGDTRLMDYNPSVKLGLSVFPRDLLVFPRSYGRTLGPVVFEATHDDGGHFAAYEKPELLVGDLRKMFGDGGGASDVTKTWAE